MPVVTWCAAHVCVRTPVRMCAGSGLHSADSARHVGQCRERAGAGIVPCTASSYFFFNSITFINVGP